MRTRSPLLARARRTCGATPDMQAGPGRSGVCHCCPGAHACAGGLRATRVLLSVSECAFLLGTPL